MEVDEVTTIKLDLCREEIEKEYGEGDLQRCRQRHDHNDDNPSGKYSQQP